VALLFDTIKEFVNVRRKKDTLFTSIKGNWEEIFHVNIKIGFFGKYAGVLVINPLPPTDLYICRTTPLTSRRCILNIYSTNIRTEYFKHAA
jgi:hypothetical protein